MAAVTEQLPLDVTHAPDSQAALVALVGDAYAAGTPIYPLGGGTSLDYGLPAIAPGVGIATSGLTRVVDYPARDMTITVEAGITMARLAETLAAERQWLPIDAPRSSEATLGGMVATNFSGPRRYGQGTLRDYVIGISAVDGRGKLFKAGGRVVKNVAGYDFCKLLTGSMGTLAVVSQLTLKIKPLPEASAFLTCDVGDLATAERLLAAMVDCPAPPAAIELLAGPHWREHQALGQLTAGAHVRLVVGVEGTAAEVHWLLEHISNQWRGLGVSASRSLHDREAQTLWTDLREFPARGDDAPLVFKASLLPGRITQFVELVQSIDPKASIQAHAGNGIVIARLATFDPGDVSRVLIGRLQPAAQAAGGSLVVLSSNLAGLTRQAVWGGVSGATAWMTKVKQQFDPKNLLNPGRFVYGLA